MLMFFEVHPLSQFRFDKKITAASIVGAAVVYSVIVGSKPPPYNVESVLICQMGVTIISILTINRMDMTTKPEFRKNPRRQRRSIHSLRR